MWKVIEDMGWAGHEPVMRSIEEARSVNAQRKQEAAEAERLAVEAASSLVDNYLHEEWTFDFLITVEKASAVALDAWEATVSCPGCDTDDEMWMVHDELWASVGLKHDDGMWCRACFENLLGRPLTAADFTGAPCNTELLAELVA